jgi:hypothetical protein
VAQTYDQTRELLARLWNALWPDLSPAQRERLLALPEPCQNHLEVRLRRPDRGLRLTAGCRRLVAFDSELFLEGLRLYPHAICRAAEALGPLPDALWSDLTVKLSEHRLWQVEKLLATSDSEDFWSAVETLEQHRELPQAILDYLESGRPSLEAPMPEFVLTLGRYLVRARLEKVRFGTYATVKESLPR